MILPQHIGVDRPRPSHPGHQLRVIQVFIIGVWVDEDTYGGGRTVNVSKPNTCNTNERRARARAAMDGEPREQSTRLVRVEGVHLKHGGGMWADGLFPEPVNPQLKSNNV